MANGVYFGNKLKLGSPQEIALLKAFMAYNGEFKELFEKSVNLIHYQNYSFRRGWNELKNSFSNPQINFLINLISRMLEKSSAETGNRINSIVQQIKTNRELIKDRESIIKAQQFKIKFLTFIMAAILGLIAGIIPLLFQISNIFENLGLQNGVLFWESFPLVLSLLIMTLYSSYFLNKLVKTNNPKQFSLWAGLFFGFFWYLTAFFV